MAVLTRSRKRSLTFKPWSEMLPELLEQISALLPLPDFVSFRGVCRKWRSAPSGRSHITGFSKQSPWLLIYRNDGGGGDTCYLYSDSHPECCTVRLPGLRGATALVSKWGWLLAHRDSRLFLYSPFSLAEIDLPPHPVAAGQAFTFTALPGSPDCTAYILSMNEKNISRMEVQWCRVGESRWRFRSVRIRADWPHVMSMALCCDCVDDGGHCSCGYTKQDIYICDRHNNFLVYNSVKQTCRVEEKMTSQSYWGRDFVEDAKDLHGRDWVQRFGGNGVSISTCGFSQWGGRTGRRPMVYSVTSGGAGVMELSNAKGTWLEPRFSRKGSK